MMSRVSVTKFHFNEMKCQRHNYRVVIHLRLNPFTDRNPIKACLSGNDCIFFKSFLTWGSVDWSSGSTLLALSVT